MCFRVGEWRVVEESKNLKLTVNGLEVGGVATADAVVCRFSSKSREEWWEALEYDFWNTIKENMWAIRTQRHKGERWVRRDCSCYAEQRKSISREEGKRVRGALDTHLFVCVFVCVRVLVLVHHRFLAHPHLLLLGLYPSLSHTLLEGTFGCRLRTKNLWRRWASTSTSWSRRNQIPFPIFHYYLLLPAFLHLLLLLLISDRIFPRLSLFIGETTPNNTCSIILDCLVFIRIWKVIVPFHLIIIKVGTAEECWRRECTWT